MERREERENLMKMFYQMNISEDYSEAEFKEYVEANMGGECSEYFSKVYSIFFENRIEIDGKIDEYSNKWKTNRMPAVDLSILRIALTEIIYMEDIPMPVSINEAVELAKKYSTEKSSGFINGLLGKAAKNNG
ncbi:MAG: transcription antitermination factor NusB [Clostridia bacterium]|nr:transcription antitermination factor NusB [Clostridia bacterium]